MNGTSDAWLSILCAVTAAVLLALLACRAVLLYRKSFITNLGSRLARCLVLTNPRFLFLVSLAFAILGGVIAYAIVGPVGFVAATALSLAAPASGSTRLACGCRRARQCA